MNLSIFWLLVFFNCLLHNACNLNPKLTLFPLLTPTSTLPGPAPLKLRPYGAIQMCILLLLLLLSRRCPKSNPGLMMDNENCSKYTTYVFPGFCLNDCRTIVVVMFMVVVVVGGGGGCYCCFCCFLEYKKWYIR